MTQQQYDYIQQVILTNIKEYPYYVCWRDSSSDEEANGIYRAKFVFSKDKIIRTGVGTYQCTENSIDFSQNILCLNNQSWFHNPTTLRKFSVTSPVFSNCSNEEYAYTLVPDITSSVNVDTTLHLQLISVVLIVFVLASCFIKLLKR